MTHKKTQVTLYIKESKKFEAYKIASLAFDFLGEGFHPDAVKLEKNIITLTLDFALDYRTATQFESVVEIFQTLGYYEEEAAEKEALEVA